MIEGDCHCGQVNWSFEGDIRSATACNCTVCRRYGALWVYGYQNEEIRVKGETKEYTRGDKGLIFHFCPNCGCIAYWISSDANEEGKYRVAVNLRLTKKPSKIERIPIRHFDGLHRFKALESKGKSVKDFWF